MKVILVNGSAHKEGATYTALCEVQKTLREEGIETEIFHIGNKAINGCQSCGGCAKLHRCVINDCVNEFVDKAREADGFVFGSPVYYAAINGALSAFMDRAFYSGSYTAVFKHKVAAGVVNARRGGNSAAFDELNKYFFISQMVVPASSYWNMTHGYTPDDVRQDLEGLRTMRILARNIAWVLKCREAAEAAGIHPPVTEPQVLTNFVR